MQQGPKAWKTLFASTLKFYTDFESLMVARIRKIILWFESMKSIYINVRSQNTFSHLNDCKRKKWSGAFHYKKLRQLSNLWDLQAKREDFPTIFLTHALSIVISFLPHFLWTKAWHRLITPSQYFFIKIPARLSYKLRIKRFLH